MGFSSFPRLAARGGGGVSPPCPSKKTDQTDPSNPAHQTDPFDIAVLSMKPRFFPLFSAAGTETPSASGTPAAAAAETTPAAPAAETPAAPAAAAEPGLVERIMSRFEEKTELTGKIKAAEATIASLTTERDGLATQLQAITGERDQAVKELADIRAALDAAEAKIKTVNEAAAEIAASASFPSASLPAAAEPPADDIAAIEKQLAASQCPKERQTLALKIKELRAEQSH